MKSKQLINRKIEVFYNKVSEETRLEKGMGIFEFERNELPRGRAIEVSKQSELV